MTKGILLVQTRAASPEQADAFNRWYDEVHIPEMLAHEGVSSARRFQVVDGDSYVAVYEVDDIEAAQASLAKAREAGTAAKPVGVQTDPPPSVQWCRLLGES